MFKLEDLSNKAKEGAYINTKQKKLSKLSENFIFDENLSIKKNKEMIKLYNKRQDKIAKEYIEEDNRLEVLFLDDLKIAISNSGHFNDKQSEFIANELYFKYHSDGYLNIIINAYNLVDFLNKFQNLDTKRTNH